MGTFNWNTFWRRQQNTTAQPPKKAKFFGLREFAESVRRKWPVKEDKDFYRHFIGLWIFVGVFCCWVITDWIFPVNPLYSIPLAFVLARLIYIVIKKLRAG